MNTGLAVVVDLGWEKRFPMARCILLVGSYDCFVGNSDDKTTYGQVGNGITIILIAGVICEWAYSQRGGGRRRSHCHPPKARCRGSMRSCTASTRCPLPEREMRNTGNTSTCKRVETGTLSPPCHMKTSQQHNDVASTHSSKRPASMLTIWESRTATASPSMFPIQASLQTIF